MAPKRVKKAKPKDKKPPKLDLKALKLAAGKPKKIPPPPACFKNEEIVMFKEIFKLYDEAGIERINVLAIPTLLRKIGFNPTGAEAELLLAQFLENDQVDMAEFHEVLFMIEAKMSWGDAFEQAVMEAMGVLGNDEKKTKFTDLEVLKEQLFKWGEPLTELEFSDWIKLATKNKTYDIATRAFAYEKFVDLMNGRDVKFLKEPINYFKLDQKTLAEMAMKKAQEENEALERKEAEKAMREETKRQKMLAEALLQPGNQESQDDKMKIPV